MAAGGTRRERRRLDRIVAEAGVACTGAPRRRGALLCLADVGRQAGRGLSTSLAPSDRCLGETEPADTAGSSRAANSAPQQPAKAADVAQRALQVFAHCLRGFGVAPLLQQIEQVQVLPRVLPVALAVVHRTV